MPDSDLHARLRCVVGDRSYREMAALTDTHPETVRRYILGHPPSAKFLVLLAERLNLNGEWLLTGRGPMHRADILPQALHDADTSQLLQALSVTLDRQTQRVDRLELFIQTVETRLRSRRRRLRSDDGQGPIAQIPARVQSISEAVAGRPSAIAS